ncbi:MAG TPA: protein kinase, partial [Candidatus Xenobia bacterium]
IVHRDIKPDNVLISKTGYLYLVDFGLARIGRLTREQLTKTGQALGTLQYMALEQMGSAKTVDARADLYSVGMLMFDLLEEVEDWHPYMADILCAEGLKMTKPMAPPLARFVEHLAAPRLVDRYQSAEHALSQLLAVRQTVGL